MLFYRQVFVQDQYFSPLFSSNVAAELSSRITEDMSLLYSFVFRMVNGISKIEYSSLSNLQMGFKD